ncbi:MAG: Rnase Y domain-containing protein, partial [Christensenellales bacterium]|nr:Rnase Y domain-containing protein [Christensenellales bacterium]
MTELWIVLAALVAAVAGVLGGYQYRKSVAERRIGRTEEYAKNLLDEAQRRAEENKKEKILEAKEEVLKLKNELDREIRDRRNELTRSERRLMQREESFDKKLDNLDAREESLNRRQSEITRMEQEAQSMFERQQGELERIGAMTQDEARQMLVSRIQKDAYHDAAVMVRDIEAAAKEEADKKARNIITMAIQKCAADHVAETTVSVVSLPNDDMKGRIIGREGRNIRALETATGVDLIIDDTPEAVIVSAFDPVRREVARLALEKLILDGRIHPARIEEM